jgi:hypothetical protein
MKNDMNIDACKYEGVLLSCCIPLQQHLHVVSEETPLCRQCTTNARGQPKKNGQNVWKTRGKQRQTEQEPVNKIHFWDNVSCFNRRARFT